MDLSTKRLLGFFKKISSGIKGYPTPQIQEKFDCYRLFSTTTSRRLGIEYTLLSSSFIGAGFLARYSYLIELPYKKATFGNQYHENTQIVFSILNGSVEITFHDRQNKKNSIILNDKDPYTVYIPPRIAYRIRNTNNRTTLLLFSDIELGHDQYPYLIK